MTLAERQRTVAAMIDEIMTTGRTRAQAEALVQEQLLEAFDVIDVEPPNRRPARSASA